VYYLLGLGGRVRRESEANKGGVQKTAGGASVLRKKRKGKERTGIIPMREGFSQKWSIQYFQKMAEERRRGGGGVVAGRVKRGTGVHTFLPS